MHDDAWAQCWQDPERGQIEIPKGRLKYDRIDPLSTPVGGGGHVGLVREPIFCLSFD